MSCLLREYIDNIGSHAVLHVHHLYWLMKNSSTSRSLWIAETVWSNCHHNHTKHLLALANRHLLHLNEWTRIIFTACTMTITPLQGHMERDSWLIRSAVFWSKTWLICCQKSNEQQTGWAAKLYNTDNLNANKGPSQHQDTSRHGMLSMKGWACTSAFSYMLLRLVVLLFACNLLGITVLISFSVGKYAVDDGCCGHVWRAL